MIIIRNNRICNPREHLALERYIRNQESKSKVLLLPEYCEVLCVGKGNPDIVLVNHEGNEIQLLRRGQWEYGKWENGHWVNGSERCRCSVCHRDFAVDNLNVWNGCPHCLAKMDFTDNISGSPDSADPV